MSDIVQSFEKPYTQMGKHRKQCRFCRKLIRDGEMAVMQKMVTEKYYPIKGTQKFQKWVAIHKTCEEDGMKQEADSGRHGCKPDSTVQQHKSKSWKHRAFHPVQNPDGDTSICHRTGRYLGED